MSADQPLAVVVEAEPLLLERVDVSPEILAKFGLTHIAGAPPAVVNSIHWLELTESPDRGGAIAHSPGERRPEAPLPSPSDAPAVAAAGAGVIARISEPRSGRPDPGPGDPQP